MMIEPSFLASDQRHDRASLRSDLACGVGAVALHDMASTGRSRTGSSTGLIACPVRIALLVIGLVAIGGVVAPELATAKRATPVRVMTWNWQNPSCDPLHEPIEKCARILVYRRGWTNVVKNQQPDILGLQEICVKWVGQLTASSVRTIPTPSSDHHVVIATIPI